MSILDPITARTCKFLNFADSIDDLIKCTKEKQYKFSFFADMPNEIQALTLSFFSTSASIQDIEAASKTCEFFYKFLKNQRMEVKRFKDEIMPYFPDWILSVFSNWRDILKIQEKEFIKPIDSLDINDITDPVIKRNQFKFYSFYSSQIHSEKL